MQLWTVFAHDGGVYSVDLNSRFVASGGDEGAVRVWDRVDGALLATLCHHEYIVWNVSLWLDNLFTCSYDCTVAYLDLRQG
jgi:WD40 repeat protein